MGCKYPLHRQEYSRRHSSSKPKIFSLRAASAIIQTSRLSPEGQNFSSILFTNSLIMRLTGVYCVAFVIRDKTALPKRPPRPKRQPVLRAPFDQKTSAAQVAAAGRYWAAAIVVQTAEMALPRCPVSGSLCPAP